MANDPDISRHQLIADLIESVLNRGEAERFFSMWSPFESFKNHICWQDSLSDVAYSVADTLIRKGIDTDLLLDSLVARAPGRSEYIEGVRVALSKRKSAENVLTPRQSQEAAKSDAPVAEWVMIGNKFFRATAIRQSSSGDIQLEIVPSTNRDKADLAALRPSRPNMFGPSLRHLEFAANNDAHLASVNRVDSETLSGRELWKVNLRIEESNRFGPHNEMAYDSYTVDDLAKLRARRLLLNDPPVRQRTAVLSGRSANEETLEIMIQGVGSHYRADHCPVLSIYRSHGDRIDWMQLARLRSVFLLLATGTVRDIIELTFSRDSKDVVAISFHGLRHQPYSNQAPAEIRFRGLCNLSKGSR